MRHSKSFLLTVLSAALLCRAVPVARADEPSYIAIHKPLTSTALVLPLEKDRLLGQGSGFLVNRDARLILTNCHVVSDKDQVIVIFPFYEKTRDGDVKARAERSFYLTPNDKVTKYKGKVLDRDAKIDLALIEMESLPNDAPELGLADASAGANDPVHVSSNPANDTHAFVYTPGTVLAVPADKKLSIDGKIRTAPFREIETAKKLWHGSSGGPVINNSGQLVAVIFAGPEGGTSRVIECIDVREVRSFMGSGLRNRATVLIQQKEYDKAIASCDLSVKYNPRDALSYNERGAAYSWKNDFDQAAENYSAAIKLDPKLATAWRNRGSAYLHKGDFEKAVADCTEALRLDPNFALAYLTRSKAHAKLKNDDAAREDSAIARRLDGSLR